MTSLNALVKLAPLLSVLAMTACQSATVTAVSSQSIAVVCDVWTPTTYSSRDTAETQMEIVAANAARDAFCE